MSNSPKNRSSKPNNGLVRHIIVSVISLLVILALAVVFLGYRYFQQALQPLNVNDNQVSQIYIPLGASNKQIGEILQNQKIVKSGMVFDYYVKSNNLVNLRAGYYQLKPSMTLKTIAQQLQKGGSDEPIQSTKGKVLVAEGANIEQISQEVGQRTDFSKSDFIKLMKDQSFIKQLAKRFPDLLSSAMKAQGVRYRLEGYLYPATYEVKKNMSLKQLATLMVAKSDQVLHPYYKQIKKTKMTIQQVLTLASLVEKEGSKQSDRQIMAGVFLNRIDQNMPIQSDISVLYAINKPSKNLTQKDLQTNSPYNLYINSGFGPGPFDSPSLNAVKAVLHPTQRSKGYLYFVANTKTGKIYYAQTFAQHQKNIHSIQTKNQKKQ